MCDSARSGRPKVTTWVHPRVGARARVERYIYNPPLPPHTSPLPTSSVSVSECARVYEGIKQRGKTHKHTPRAAANIGCPVTWQRTHIAHRLPPSTSKWVLMWNECVRVRACVSVCPAMNESRVRGCQAFPPRFLPPRLRQRVHARVRVSWLHSQQRIANLETSASLNVQLKRSLTWLDKKCKNGQSLDWKILKSAFYFENGCVVSHLSNVSTLTSTFSCSVTI